jgi:hypothetical protein
MNLVKKHISECQNKSRKKELEKNQTPNTIRPHARAPSVTFIIIIIKVLKENIVSFNSQIHNFLSLDTHVYRLSYNTKLLLYILNKYIKIFHYLCK